MYRNTFLNVFFSFLIILIFTFTNSPAQKVKDYNILIIMTDEMRPDHLGCYGHPTIKTPNIDQLAREGFLLWQYYVEMPISHPSRCALFTGRNPQINGVRNNLWLLQEHEYTLAEALKDNGYQTAAFMSNINIRSKFGTAQGFDVYDFIEDPTEMRKPAQGGGPPRVSLAPPGTVPLEDYVTPQVTTRSLEWLNDHYKEKFFLWVDYIDPHGPLNPPAPYDNMYYSGSIKLEDMGQTMIGLTAESAKNPEMVERFVSLYDGEITFLDDYVGKVFDRIKELGLEEKTIIFFISDHGEMQGEHGLHGKPAVLYEPLVRAVCIIKYPPAGSAGKTIRALAQNIDIYPTVMDMLNITKPSQVQGTSLVPLLEGTASSVHKEIVLSFTGGGRAQKRAVRTPEWKYIHSLDGKHELFNLLNDPEENNNLFDFRPDIVRDLRERLINWYIRTEDTLPGPSGTFEDLFTP